MCSWANHQSKSRLQHFERHVQIFEVEAVQPEGNAKCCVWRWRWDGCSGTYQRTLPLSRAITEYLKTAEVNECLPYLSKDDIPDLDVREKLKQVDPLLFALDRSIWQAILTLFFLQERRKYRGNSAMTAKQKLWVVCINKLYIQCNSKIEFFWKIFVKYLAEWNKLLLKVFSYLISQRELGAWRKWSSNN